MARFIGVLILVVCLPVVFSMVDRKSDDKTTKPSASLVMVPDPIVSFYAKEPLHADTHVAASSSIGDAVGKEIGGLFGGQVKGVGSSLFGGKKKKNGNDHHDNNPQGRHNQDGQHADT